MAVLVLAEKGSFMNHQTLRQIVETARSVRLLYLVVVTTTTNDYSIKKMHNNLPLKLHCKVNFQPKRNFRLKIIINTNSDSYVNIPC